MDPEQVPIKTFDPLLRDLLYWGLLVRTEEPGGGQWQLAARATERLNDIAAETRPFSAERMVFLDHRCGTCGLRRLTRLRDSRYVCDSCWEAAAHSPTVENPVDTAAATPDTHAVDATTSPLREHRWTPPWRQRTA
jgi:hypothetical protein